MIDEKMALEREANIWNQRDPWALDRFAEAEIVLEATLAVKVSFKSGHMEWIPKTAIHELSEIRSPGRKGQLILDGWFARKRSVKPPEGERKRKPLSASL